MSVDLLAIVNCHFLMFSECLKLTEEIKEEIVLSLATSPNISVNYENCEDTFDSYLLPLEQFKTVCSNQTEFVPSVCIWKLIVIELESVMNEMCVEFIAPIIKCLGVELNVTELGHRTSRNEDNFVTQTEL